MPKYWDYLREACGQTPTWWWVVAVLITIGSLIITLSGSTPDPIRHNWALFILVLFVLLFFAVTIGTHKMFENHKAACASQVAELRLRVDQIWDEKVKDVQLLQDERDIPVVIREMMEQQGIWMRENNQTPGSPGIHKDENWFVDKMKFKRNERIVRKAYKHWQTGI